MEGDSGRDLEHEPIPAADATRAAPGRGAGERDPAAAVVADSAASVKSKPTNAGRVWVAIAVATALLILLIIFIAENSESVTVSFLGANAHISLGLALLIAAVAGAVVTLLVGTARILQLRREVRRRHRRPRPDEDLSRPADP